MLGDALNEPHPPITQTSARSVTDASAAPEVAPGRAAPEPPAEPAGLTVRMLGRTYPFDLYTHCGIEYAPFGGKTWKAVTPLPEPRAKAGEDGITVYSGYTAGTMTLVDASTARFVADLRYTEVAESVVEFEVSDKPAPGCK